MPFPICSAMTDEEIALLIPDLKQGQCLRVGHVAGLAVYRGVSGLIWKIMATRTIRNGVSRTFTYNLGPYDKITVEAAADKARWYVKTLGKMCKRTSDIETLAAISPDTCEAATAENPSGKPPASPERIQELYREIYEDALRTALEAKAKADVEAAIKAMSLRRN